MKKILLIFLSLFFIPIPFTAYADITPVLEYANAGCLSDWTEEAYYSSPAVEDIDGDGRLEIIFSNYSITVLDAATGKEKWKVNSGRDRSSAFEEFNASNGHTWSDVTVEDINGDGKKEIITGHGHGIISVLDSNGYFMPDWPQKPADVSIRSIEVADIDGDGKKEIIAGLGIESNTSVYVYSYDGKLRNGWPQTNDRPDQWLYGVFMDNITTADLDYDGRLEIIVPSDLSFISIFEPDGTSYFVNREVFGYKSWGEIAMFEDYAAEIRSDNGGWGNPITGGELRESLYKAEFGHAKCVVYDLDSDGKKEIITSVLMCNRKHTIYPPTEYMTIAILNSDRTRYRNDALGYNWETLPTDLGKPLYQNPLSIVSNVFSVPVVEDIDADGAPEILFNSYNGKVHCFSLKKTEPYAWPFSLTKRTSPRFEYASPVACVDVDKDGKKEIIFTSYYDNAQAYGVTRGSLYILNYEGKLISKVTLPDSTEPGRKSNGGMAKPVVADIDGDGLYEVVINTLSSAVCAYKLR